MFGMTPSEIVVGLVGLVFFAIFALEFLAVIDRKRHKNHDDDLKICASSEAVNTKYKLQSEFNRLVSKIAWYNAGLVKESDTEGKILISPEDMEKAFLEAAKLVTEKCALDRCPCKTNCDKQTVLQRIQNIRKNFEEKSPTP